MQSILLLVTLLVSSQSMLDHKIKLLRNNNTIATLLERMGATWDANENGIWGRLGVSDEVKSLVVIGGSDFSTVEYLVSIGYTVWGRRKKCAIVACCRESVGYSTYLADMSNPKKPTGEFVTFIHGHLEAWHQTDDIHSLIQQSILCASQTGRYASLGWIYQPSIPAWIEKYDFETRWKRSSLHPLLPAPSVFNGFMGGQFTILQKLIGMRSEKFYETLLGVVSPQKKLLKNKKFCELDAFDLEFTWGYIFGEDPNINTTSKTLYPAGTCTGAKKKPRLTKPLLRWPTSGRQFFHDAEGWWMFPSAPKDEIRITVVFGSDPTELMTSNIIESILSTSLGSTFGVWIRQPTYNCPYGSVNVNLFVGGAPCSHTEGYSRFMAHYGLDDVNGADHRDLQSDVFVFVSGLINISATDILYAALKSRERKGYFPAGKFARPHARPVMVRSWPRESPFKAAGQGFATSDFVVPAKSVYEIDPMNVGYVRELTTPLVILHLKFLEFYWHTIFGEPNQLTIDTVSPSDNIYVLLKYSTPDDTEYNNRKTGEWNTAFLSLTLLLVVVIIRLYFIRANRPVKIYINLLFTATMKNGTELFLRFATRDSHVEEEKEAV